MPSYTNSDEFDDLKYDARHGGHWVARWIIVIVVFALLIGGAIWGIKVLIAPVKGEGDKQIIKHDANNMIAAQERFEDLYQDILATDRKITVAREAEGDTAATNLQGLQSYCLSVVGEYNAAARKFTQADFKAVDLPSKIDNSNPEVDCK